MLWGSVFLRHTSVGKEYPAPAEVPHILALAVGPGLCKLSSTKSLGVLQASVA